MDRFIAHAVGLWQPGLAPIDGHPKRGEKATFWYPSYNLLTRGRSGGDADRVAARYLPIICDVPCIQTKAMAGRPTLITMPTHLLMCIVFSQLSSPTRPGE